MAEEKIVPLSEPLAGSPWGYFQLELTRGRFAGWNEAFRFLFDLDEEFLSDISFEEIFLFGLGESFAKVRGALQREGTWRGRVTSREALGKVVEAEILLQLGPDEARIEGYLLEHPMIGGRIEESARSEINMLGMIMAHSPDVIFIRDRDGRLMLSSHSFRKSVGLPPEGANDVGKRLNEFLDADSVKRFQEIDAAIFESGEASVNEIVELGFAQGEVSWWMITAAPLKNSNGRVIGTLCVARDVSERKHYEQELRVALDKVKSASMAKSDFMATMSHEIRTPINGVIGAAELCEETALSAEQRGYMETIIQSGTTLLALVNDVLDFSKIEAGQMKLERVSFSPRQVLQEVLKGFAVTAREKGLTLDLVCPDTLPSEIMGDPMRFRQVISNLVGNGVKFTKAGSVLMQASVENESKYGVTLSFVVEDTGIGISEDRLEAIFESFTQGDMSTTRHFGGTGLGLSICRTLVTLMGGTLEVESTLGKGSRFTFTLPCELPPKTKPLKPARAVSLQGLRVLVVDAHQTNREISLAMLKSWGCEGTGTDNAADALLKVRRAARREAPYQLLLLDQQMPGLSGLDFAESLRGEHSARDCVVILLSTAPNREEEARAADLGIERVLSKPVQKHLLKEVVLDLLGIQDEEMAEPPEVGEAVAEAGRKVLLAEDNLVNQTIARTRLEKMGHQVTVVEDGAQAIAACEKERFDLILMDVEMPDVDGLEATRQIRVSEQASGRVPAYIVAITANAMEEDRQSCLDAGMNDYISKPFRAERLKRVLGEMEAAFSAGAGGAIRKSVETEIRGWFAELSPDDRFDMLEAAKVFADSLTEELVALRRAVAEQYAKKLTHYAHQVKGVASVFEASDLMEAAQSLEAELAAGGSWTAIQQKAKNLENALIALERALRAVSDIYVSSS